VTCSRYALSFILEELLTSCVQTGIGKSMMSYQILHLCSTEKRRVVLRKAGWNGEQAHLFCEDGVFSLNELEFRREMRRPDVLYVPVLTCFLLRKVHCAAFFGDCTIHTSELVD
jgi:hypothetical protein